MADTIDFSKVIKWEIPESTDDNKVWYVQTDALPAGGSDNQVIWPRWWRCDYWYPNTSETYTESLLDIVQSEGESTTDSVVPGGSVGWDRSAYHSDGFMVSNPTGSTSYNTVVVSSTSSGSTSNISSTMTVKSGSATSNLIEKKSGTTIYSKSLTYTGDTTQQLRYGMYTTRGTSSASWEYFNLACGSQSSNVNTKVTGNYTTPGPFTVSIGGKLKVSGRWPAELNNVGVHLTPWTNGTDYCLAAGATAMGWKLATGQKPKFFYTGS